MAAGQKSDHKADAETSADAESDAESVERPDPPGSRTVGCLREGRAWSGHVSSHRCRCLCSVRDQLRS